ncbi:hypothetical protein JW859_01000 [bacterium]|nr:hypothetical protein [bacterium]
MGQVKGVIVVVILLAILGTVGQSARAEPAGDAAEAGYVLAYLNGFTIGPVDPPDSYDPAKLPVFEYSSQPQYMPDWFGFYTRGLVSAGGAVELVFATGAPHVPRGIPEQCSCRLELIDPYCSGEPLAIERAADSELRLDCALVVSYTNVLDSWPNRVDTTDRLLFIPAGNLPDTKPLIAALDPVYLAELPAMLYPELFLDFADDSAGVTLLAEYYGMRWAERERDLRYVTDRGSMFFSEWPYVGEPHIAVMQASGDDGRAAITTLLTALFAAAKRSPNVAPWYAALPDYVELDCTPAQLLGLRRVTRRGGDGAEDPAAQDPKLSVYADLFPPAPGTSVELLAPGDFLAGLTALSNWVVIALSDADGRVHLQFYPGLAK